MARIKYMVMEDTPGELKGTVNSFDSRISQANSKVDTLKSDVDAHKVDYVKNPIYATAAGTANAITITQQGLLGYVDGMGVILKVTANNTDRVTVSINGIGGIPVLKGNGTLVQAPNTFKAGSIYSLRYNASQGNFILQGEGGDYGNVTAADVRKGKTAGTDSGLVTGTMPALDNIFLNQSVISVKEHSIVFSGGFTTGFFTTDNRYFIGVAAATGSLTKYDLITGSYTGLGNGGWGTSSVNVVCGSDDGETVFVGHSNNIYMYKDGSWSTLTSSTASNSSVICCNADGSVVFFRNGSGYLHKIITATKASGQLGLDLVTAMPNALFWVDDDSVWYNFSSTVFKKIRVYDGSILATVTAPNSIVRYVNFARSSTASIFGIVNSGTSSLDYVAIFNKDGTTAILFSDNTGVSQTVSKLGNWFYINSINKGFYVYKLDGSLTLDKHIPGGITFPYPYAGSNNGKFINSGSKLLSVEKYI